MKPARCLYLASSDSRGTRQIGNRSYQVVLISCWRIRTDPFGQLFNNLITVSLRQDSVYYGRSYSCCSTCERQIPMKTPANTILCLSLVILLLGGCSRKSSDQANAIQIKGSDTMVNLGQAWAEDFMKLHPGSSIAVTGGGSGTGISAMVNNTCDIAEVSREMKDSE